MEILRAETLALRAGAYYVRIQGMAEAHGIPLEREFDERDTPETQYILAREGFLPAATVRLSPMNDNRMLLGRIVVLPEHRGKGLGKAVVLAAEQWAKEQGFTVVQVDARVEKQGFYEHLGYHAVTGEIIPGETFDTVSMEKEI